jgi:hypothetical protein
MGTNCAARIADLFLQHCSPSFGGIVGYNSHRRLVELLVKTV